MPRGNRGRPASQQPCGTQLGYDAVLLLDAHASGASDAVPGTVRLLEPLLPDLSTLDQLAMRDYFADTHYATPLRALALLERLGRLPRVVAVIGCEPAPGKDTLTIGLSASVAAALDAAEVLAVAWMSRFANTPIPEERKRPAQARRLNCKIARSITN